MAGEWTRRQFVAGLAAAWVAWAGVGHAALAQTGMTGEAAMRELMAGNERYIAGKITSFPEDLKILKEKTVMKQEPFAAVLACADSRVPVEILFDQSIGHVFVARVAGNIVTPEIMASLEYGVAVLGVKAILVIGAYELRRGQRGGCSEGGAGADQRSVSTPDAGDQGSEGDVP